VKVYKLVSSTIRVKRNFNYTVYKYKSAFFSNDASHIVFVQWGLFSGRSGVLLCVLIICTHGSACLCYIKGAAGWGQGALSALLTVLKHVYRPTISPDISGDLRILEIFSFTIFKQYGTQWDAVLHGVLLWPMLLANAITVSSEACIKVNGCKKSLDFLCSSYGHPVQRIIHFSTKNFFISSPNPIELPLIRIVFEKTILMSDHSIEFGEEIMILKFSLCTLSGALKICCQFFRSRCLVLLSLQFCKGPFHSRRPKHRYIVISIITPVIFNSS